MCFGTKMFKRVYAGPELGEQQYDNQNQAAQKHWVLGISIKYKDLFITSKRERCVISPCDTMSQGRGSNGR